MRELAQLIEALLLVSGEAVTVRELARTAGCSEADVRAAVDELADSLRGHGIATVATRTQVQLVTSDRMAQRMEAMVERPDRTLSAAAAETLSVVAYRGPLALADINSIRGVDSRRSVQALVTSGIVETKGPRSSGRHRYQVTTEFLRRAGVERPEDLPRYAELSTPREI